MGQQQPIKTLSVDILNVLLSDSDFNHRMSVPDICKRLVALYRYECGLGSAKLSDKQRLTKAATQKKRQVQKALDEMIKEQERREAVRKELSGLKAKAPKDVVRRSDATSPILFSGIQIKESIETLPSSNRKVKYYWIENRLLDDFQIELLANLARGLTFLENEKAVDNLVHTLKGMQSKSARRDSEETGTSGNDASSETFDKFIDIWKRLDKAIQKKYVISFKYRRPVAQVVKKGKKKGDPAICEVVPDKNDKRVRRNYLSPYKLHYSDGHVYLLTSTREKQWRSLDETTGLFLQKEREGEGQNNANGHAIDPLALYRVEWIDDLQLIEADEKHPYREIEDSVINEYLSGSFKGYGSRERLQNIRLICTERALPYVYEHFSYFANSADDGRVKVIREKNLTKDGRDWYQVSFRAHPDSVRNWVLGWPRDIVVTEPLSLTRTIMEAFERNAYEMFPDLVKGLAKKKPDDVAPEDSPSSESTQ